MTSDSGTESLEDDLVELVRRHEVFEVLDDAVLEKPDLSAALDVSPATTHRILSSFREKEWIERTDEGYALTPFGRAMGRTVRTYRSTVADTRRLAPLYETVSTAEIPLEVDFDWFDDATVTVVEPHDPYRPLNRFIDLLEGTSSLRGFDTTSVAPTYVEDVYGRIVDGMAVEIVYEEAVVERLATEYADLAADAFERENLSLWLRDEVPFGLALFDDRIGIGGYDEETGLLEVFADTGDTAALEWGERLFERYKADSTPL